MYINLFFSAFQIIMLLKLMLFTKNGDVKVNFSFFFILQVDS